MENYTAIKRTKTQKFMVCCHGNSRLDNDKNENLYSQVNSWYFQVRGFLVFRGGGVCKSPQEYKNFVFTQQMWLMWSPLGMAWPHLPGVQVFRAVLSKKEQKSVCAPILLPSSAVPKPPRCPGPPSLSTVQVCWARFLRPCSLPLGANEGACANIIRWNIPECLSSFLGNIFLSQVMLFSPLPHL